MKLEVTFTISKAESDIINELESWGWLKLPAGVILKVEEPIAIPADKLPSTAPIGKTVNGFQITHYGYPGDSSPDTNSMKGIGDHGNKLTPNLSAALTENSRVKFFGVTKPSTGKTFSITDDGVVYEFRDDDSAPEQNSRIDVYDPYYIGRDTGCTDEMYAKSRAEMVAAGILT